MKDIFVKISGITGNQLNATEFTYFITFPKKLDYSYTIRATEEGFNRMVDLWQEAGYTVKFKD